MNEINIAICASDNYSPYICTVMASALYNNSDCKINFMILSDYISAENRLLIQKLNQKFSNFEIHFISIDASRFSRLKNSIPYISYHTYIRYIIAEVCPDIDKILYLDCDLVINGSLKEFWNTDLTDYYCAGVRDNYVESIDYKKTLGFNADELYINAGVMLLNLQKIRRDNMIERLFETTERYKDIIKFMDQDSINLTFKNKIREVSNIYNYTSYDVGNNELIKIEEAIIIHFIGSNKPWMFPMCSGNPSEYLYFKYLKMTPFRFLSYDTLLNRIKSFVYRNDVFDNRRRIKIMGLTIKYKLSGK